MKIIFSFLLLFNFTLSYSQDKSEIILIADGQGKTKNEAIQNALRNAIEQAYGAFISTNTQISKDILISDDITSISQGNIKSYQVLSENKMQNEVIYVTVKTIVSISKLTTFVQSKGGAVDVNGNLYALNIKNHQLNQRNEIKIIYNMLLVIHELMQKSFDYEISSSEPFAKGSYYAIPLTITVKTNENIIFCRDLFESTLEAIRLKGTEVDEFNKCIGNSYKYLSSSKYFGYTFRNETTIELIDSFFSMLNSFYSELFEVTPFVFNKWKINSSRKYNQSKSFPSGLVCQFSQDVYYDLATLEKISGFKVKPLGVVSKIGKGGFIINDNLSEGGIVVSLIQGYSSYNEAINYIKTLNNEKFCGFSDWRLPSNEELIYIANNSNGIFGYESTADGKDYFTIHSWTSSTYCDKYQCFYYYVGAERDVNKSRPYFKYTGNGIHKDFTQFNSLKTQAPYIIVRSL